MIHRAYSMGEATLFRLADGPEVPVASRRMFSAAWVRHIMWRRAQDATANQRQVLSMALLGKPLEKLIADIWPWYGPLMHARRQRQLIASGDRLDIFAIDGNAKLYRRTCGMPFAEIVCAEIE